MRNAECGIEGLGSIRGACLGSGTVRDTFRIPHSTLRIRGRAGRGLAAAAAVAGRLDSVPVAACYDALRGQVYGAVYVFRPDEVETALAPAVATVAELARVAPPLVRPRVVVGDGAMRYPDDILRWSGAAAVPLESLMPNATTLLSLFTRKGAARSLDDPLVAEPAYGRPAEAQAKWEARHGRPLPDPSRPSG